MAAPAPARRPPPPPPPPPAESALPPAAPRPQAPVPPPPPPGLPEPAFVPPALPGHYARGDAIGDSYRVEKVLGEGGFGIVYLVQARRGGGRVAVKTIRDEWLRDDATRAMFRKEAELWIALGRHPYLVRADFVDEEHGRLFLVMEYIAPDARGMSGLQDRLERDPPDLDQALRYAVQFCHGMEYAYLRGIRCHRDIKPANILIGTDGGVRITDFGIAGVVAPGAEAPPAALVEGMGGTVAGAVFGTPTHMPPEQFVDAASCDERSDIYSFGIVLYQMAARGALPFLPQVAPGPDAGRRFFAEMRRLHETAEPLPLDSPLMPVIARCLQKDRAHRYPAFAALRADLEHLLRERTGEEVTVPQGGKTAAEDLCQRGISMASLGRHQEALACYDEALALSPDEPNLHNNRGNALSNLGRLDEALGAFARAIDLRPRNDSAFANRALAYARAGRFAEALRDCDLALALNARSSEAWQARGVALSNLGRRDESIAAYDAALAIDARDPLAWGNKAGELLEAGRLAEAIECYDRALALDPHAQARWVGKATALGQMGRNEESLPCFDEALRLDPKNPQAYYNKGNSLVQLQRYEEALSHFAEANRLAPRVGVVWYNRAVCELVLEQPQQAGASLRRYLSLDPPPDALTDQARWFLHGIDTGELKRLARGQGPPKPGELRPAEEMKEKAPALPASAAPDVQPPRAPRLPSSRAAPASSRVPPPRPPAPAAPKARAGPAPAASGATRARSFGARPEQRRRRPLPGRALRRGAGHLRTGPRAGSVRRRGPRQSRERPLQARQDRRSDRGPRARPGLRSLLPPELGQQGGHRADERTPGRGPGLVPRGRGSGGRGPGSHARGRARQGPTARAGRSQGTAAKRAGLAGSGREARRGRAVRGGHRRARSSARGGPRPHGGVAHEGRGPASAQADRRRHGPRRGCPATTARGSRCSGMPGPSTSRTRSARRRPWRPSTALWLWSRAMRPHGATVDGPSVP